MTESQAQKLAAWRQAQQQHGLPERDLLRDMLYILQGIDGASIRFLPPSVSAQGPVVIEAGIQINEAKGRVPQPTKDLIHRLAELGYLYRKISSAIDAASAPQARIGLIEQSLYHAVQKELTAYYRLIAVLESRLASADDTLLKPLDVDMQQELPLQIDAEAGLTLRRLLLWTEDTKLKLRMMAVLIEGCSRAQGGALVSLIHTYTSHGDPFIRTLTDQLLEEVSRPFFVTLARWIYEGELHDPFHEFFVDLNADLKSVQFGHRRNRTEDLMGAAASRALGIDPDTSREEDPDAYQLWEKKFGFREEMLPAFVSESFGRKVGLLTNEPSLVFDTQTQIFSTGKSLNFIKYSCHDSDWVVTRNKMSNSEGQALQYSDIAGLEQSIDKAYNTASQRLFDIFIEKFRLLDYLRALKDYLLLGKGDFIELLMESLGNSLDRPANTLYRHHLTACLETAIRGSSAAIDSPDTLRRLDARMAEPDAEDVEEKSGWQSFMLEFKVDAPLDTILTPDAMSSYNKLFTQLWMTKRVELASLTAWQKVMTLARDYDRVPDLRPDFQQARVYLSGITHFIRQLQYFYNLEVISCAWQDLEIFLDKKQGDLDTLIDTHQAYLNRLTQKCLLVVASKSGNEDTLLKIVRDVFDLILAFVKTVESLCNYALTEASRLDALKDEARGIAPQRIPEQDDEILFAIRRRLHKYGGGFQEEIVRVITILATHQDLDLRFLSVRLNFSLHYVLGKKRHDGKG